LFISRLNDKIFSIKQKESDGIVVAQQVNGQKNGTEAADGDGSIHPSCLKPNLFSIDSKKLISSKQLRWLMLALLPLLILLAYPVDRSDYDLWWQMALAKYYIANKTLIIDHSIFSWTPADSTWIYNTCLGSIVVYLFYYFMGGFGLWLFQWFIFAGIYLSFYLFLRLIRQRLDINSITIIAAVGIACSMSCRYYKPELFSALLFCWAVFILFYIKVKRTKYLFYLYPVIFALWVNLHGAFLVGLIFLGISFTGEILNRVFFSRESLTKDELVHFGIACVLSSAATLLNPYGVNYLLSLFPTVMNVFYMGKYSAAGTYEKLVLAYASLWPFLKSVKIAELNYGIAVWIINLMILSLAILVFIELIKRRSMDFTTLILSVVFYWKGMETSRTSHFFPIFFFFAFFYLLTCRLKLQKIALRLSIISFLLFAFFFVSLSYFNIRYRTDSNWFGRGLENFVPVKEVEFLKKHKLEGPLFNDYLVGGYLVWELYPDYKVFIDPRGGSYSKEVLPDYWEFVSQPASKESIQQFRSKYPFKIAVLHFRQIDLIIDFLKNADEWRLLYFEKNAVILIHKSLFPFVQWREVNASLSPLRFREVKNPDTLVNLFNVYVHYNPQAGKYIYDIFQKNVSDFFYEKNNVLTTMANIIRIKEKDVQNKAGKPSI